MLFYAQQVRVAGYEDRGGIQQALDLGADGILIPYINTAEEAAAGVSCWCVLQVPYPVHIGYQFLERRRVSYA